jgi:hypothetical protein
MSSGPCQQLLQELTSTWRWEAPNAHGILKPFNGKPDFKYGAEMHFTQPAEKTKKAFVVSSVSSWPEGGRGERGMHYDVGFLRCVAPDRLEWNIASNAGATEVLSGPVTEQKDGKHQVFVAQLDSTSIGGLDKKATARRLTLSNSGPLRTLQHHFYMTGADGVQLHEHLAENYEPMDKSK